MDSLCNGMIELLDKPEDYLRPSDKWQIWVEQTRKVYNFVKEEEEKYSLPASEDALRHLHTEGLDTEQIWQLLELQNKRLLAAPEDLDGLDDINLCFSVAKLSSLAKYDKLFDDDIAGKLDAAAEDEDNIHSESSDIEGKPKSIEGDSDSSEDEDEGMGSLENLNEDDDGTDEELLKEPGEDYGGLDLDFDDDSDKEVDNFDELIAPEGMEDSDDDDAADDDANYMARKKKSKVTETKPPKIDSENEKDWEEEKPKNVASKSKRFRKTEVDSKFFRLRECEWVADNDIIGDNYDVESEDIDLMKDISDGEEDEMGAMYDAFFDGAEEKKSRKSSVMPQEEVDDGSEDIEEEEYSDQEMETDIKRTDILGDENSLDEEGNEVTQLLGSKKKEEKSTFEKERERELMLMSTLEEDNIAEKPWFLKGEAVRADRPENSTLEEQLEYNIVARQRPVITEDTTSLVEKIILNRIRSKVWDDVARVVKPNLDPFEYKKKLLLDQEKSKKSLAEIYEDEYIKQQQNSNSEKPEEELPEHKEIREKMDKLFDLLDGLANYHYTPRMASAEVKIQSNLPAITMEEATPVTATDATLLAPQEILAPVQGELLGKSERTTTDKKRERRSKKALQKKKAKRLEKGLHQRLNKSALGEKKLDKATTLKIVEKAVKTGQVKLSDGGQDKAVRSSQTFFKKLQEVTSSGSKPKKPGSGKKKKGEKSVSKILL